MTRKKLLALIVALCFSIVAIAPAYSTFTGTADAKTYSKKAKSKKRYSSRKSRYKKYKKSKKYKKYKKSKKATVSRASAQSYIKGGAYLITIPTTKRNVKSVQKRVQKWTGHPFARTSRNQLQIKIDGGAVPWILDVSRAAGYRYPYVKLVSLPAPPVVAQQAQATQVSNNAAASVTIESVKPTLFDKLKAGDNSKVIVAVDAGHGGHDPGVTTKVTLSETQTVALNEKDINLDVALKLEALLKLSGYNVIMTRSTDVFITLEERANIANRAGADIFVSIHHNSAAPNTTAGGTEVYSYRNSTTGASSPTGAALASTIQTELVKSLWQGNPSKDRGNKTANFSVLRNTEMTAALTEAAFFSNPSEAALMVTDPFRQAEAQGIFNGIQGYFYRIVNSTSL